MSFIYEWFEYLFWWKTGWGKKDEEKKKLAVTLRDIKLANVRDTPMMFMIKSGFHQVTPRVELLYKRNCYYTKSSNQGILFVEGQVKEASDEKRLEPCRMEVGVENHE